MDRGLKSIDHRVHEEEMDRSEIFDDNLIEDGNELEADGRRDRRYRRVVRTGDMKRRRKMKFR
jgi:hypothetical protein